MKKLICFPILAISLLSMGACGNKENSTKEMSTISSTTQAQAERKKGVLSKYARGLEISLGEIHISEDGMAKDKNILLIKVKAKNLNTDEMGIGSTDFVLKNGKEIISPYEDGINFMEAGIKKDQTVEGTMTFKIPKNLKKATLSYRPFRKEAATWNIEF